MGITKSLFTLIKKKPAREVFRINLGDNKNIVAIEEQWVISLDRVETRIGNEVSPPRELSRFFGENKRAGWFGGGDRKIGSLFNTESEIGKELSPKKHETSDKSK